MEGRKKAGELCPYVLCTQQWGHSFLDSSPAGFSSFSRAIYSGKPPPPPLYKRAPSYQGHGSLPLSSESTVTSCLLSCVSSGRLSDLSRRQCVPGLCVVPSPWQLLRRAWCIDGGSGWENALGRLLAKAIPHCLEMWKSLQTLKTGVCLVACLAFSKWMVKEPV